VQVSLSLPTHRVDVAELVGADGIMAVARAAEAAGFAAVFVTEHPFPGTEWLASGGHHALDPFVALSFAAAATTRLRLQTNLVIPAYRSPFLLAKAVASLDACSGGRVILGMGAGYLEPEFSALGIGFSERNELFDDALEAMKAAWSGEPVVAEGPHWRAPGNAMLPRPVQRPHPPLWIGGNTSRAMRRAVEHGDGWVPMLAPAGMSGRVRTRPLETVADLGARIAEARALAVEIGRTRPFDVAFSPAGASMGARSRGGVARLVDHAAELAAAGVTFLNTGVPGPSLDELLDNIAWFGAEVLPAIAAEGPVT